MNETNTQIIVQKLSETYDKVRLAVLREYNVPYITNIPDERFEDVCDLIQELHQDIVFNR